MQSGDKYNVVAILKLVFVLSFKLPICIVDQYQYARPSEERQLSLKIIHPLIDTDTES